MLRRPWLLLILFAASASSSAAGPYVPGVLEPWRQWVLDRHPDHPCPPDYDDATVRPCLWMRSLRLELGDTGGSFESEVDLFAQASVGLPGGDDVWPTDVKVDGAPGIVTSEDGRPRLLLEPGRYTITGTLRWSHLPDSLLVPRASGLLRLMVNGKTIAEPRRDGDKLLLGKTAAGRPEVASDSLSARVYRRIDDGVPLTLDTFIDLSVAGSHRIVTLGRAVPEGFVATAVTSALPARLNDDGMLEVQVEPGESQIHIVARALSAPTHFVATPVTPNWPAEEIWGFQADRALRVVDVEGAKPIDLSQTNAPFGDVPAFVVTADSGIDLVEKFRGDPNPTPNDYALSRDLWLSFDGTSYTLRDDLKAMLQRPTRLTASFVPGRIEVDGKAQLITQLGDSAPGIEVAGGKHHIVAVSELPRDALTTAVGWQADVTSLSARLHLPPGWRLLWTRGVDHAPSAWLAAWSLWDIFLVVISAVLALRLLGRGAALLTALALIVTYQESGAPVFAWLVLLLLFALVRVSRGRFVTWARGSYLLVLAVTVLAVVGFAIDHLRIALYPQLAGPGYTEPSYYAMPAAPAPKPVGIAADQAVRAAKQTMSSVQEVLATRPPTEVYQGNTQVQTGPAVPEWHWVDAPLNWDGPVTAEQPLTLALAGPWLTRAWNVLGPLLLVLLTAVFATASAPPTVSVPSWLRRLAPVAAALLLVPYLFLHAPPAAAAAADLPDQQLLNELERKLTAPPRCLPGCAAVGQAKARLDGDRLELELVVDAQTAVALPLPEPDGSWWPSAVRDGDHAATLARDDGGRLTIALTPGVHALELSGPVIATDRFELRFPLRPGNVALDLSGWRVFGERDGQLRGNSLQFERLTPATGASAAATLAPAPITPYFELRRRFDFGLEWRIHTTLTRLAPENGGLAFSIPLVAGEALLDGNVRSENGRIVGVLDAGAKRLEWNSALAQTERLQLTAPPVADWSERWTLEPSNFWHVETTGIAPLKSDPGQGLSFQPAGNDTLTLTISRPTPVPGETMTLERVDLTDNPGARTRRSTVALTLRSSQGGNYPLTLPEGATILGVTIDGTPQPVSRATAPLQLPVVPGEQQITVSFETPAPVSTLLRTSAVQFAGDAANVTLHLELPRERWPLLLGGPRLGPAVLFWGVLVVVIGLALGLSRIRGLPITTVDAVLLGFGMTLCNLPSTLLVAAWLLLLLARQRNSERLHATSNATFQFVQIMFGLVSVAALIALAKSVPAGLLGMPDMQIVGNGSSSHDYIWFADRTGTAGATAWVISLPLWVYRVVMLAWSLWLAFAVVRWVRWSWDAFTAGGIWKGRGRAPAGAGSG